MSKFQVGDRVRIKSWDSMVEEYTLEKGQYGGIKLPVSRFDYNMKELCGLTATIRKIDFDIVYLKDWSDGNTHAWTFSTYMIEKDMELVKSKEPVLFINPNGLEVKCQNIIVDKYQTQIDYYNKIFNKEKYDRYVKGEWNNMNKVLELWYTRKHNNIMKEYEEKKIEFNNSKELVIKYKEILDRFENELEELYESEENKEQNYIINTITNNLYEYNIDYKKLNNEFVEEYISERDERINELNELRKEIDAQLSLSDELEYQVDVLMRYGVLDKKTKKMVD